MSANIADRAGNGFAPPTESPRPARMRTTSLVLQFVNRLRSRAEATRNAARPIVKLSKRQKVLNSLLQTIAVTASGLLHRPIAIEVSQARLAHQKPPGKNSFELCGTSFLGIRGSTKAWTKSSSVRWMSTYSPPDWAQNQSQSAVSAGESQSYHTTTAGPTATNLSSATNQSGPRAFQNDRDLDRTPSASSLPPRPVSPINSPWLSAWIREDSHPPPSHDACNCTCHPTCGCWGLSHPGYPSLLRNAGSYNTSEEVLASVAADTARFSHPEVSRRPSTITSIMDGIGAWAVDENAFRNPTSPRFT